jgi:hypothetical protein
MPMELAVEAAPPLQILKRLILAVVVIAVGIVVFDVGTKFGAAKQLAVDQEGFQAQFTAWHTANACVEVPAFLRGDTAHVTPYPKKHGVQ